MMLRELYIQALPTMFLFWNSVRILTYVPTIAKLLAANVDTQSHSLLSWASWVLSNATFALMLLETNNGLPSQMFWMNLGNTLMCLIVSFLIVFRRKSRRSKARRIRAGDLLGSQVTGSGQSRRV